MTPKKKTKPALWTLTAKGKKQIRDQHRKGLATEEKFRKRRKRIRPVSKSRAKQNQEYRKQKAKLFRTPQPCACEGQTDLAGRYICGTGRLHNAKEIHHMRGRAGDLLTEQSYFLLICRNAHNWIQDNPARAKALGFIQGPWNHQPKEKAA